MSPIVSKPRLKLAIRISDKPEPCDDSHEWDTFNSRPLIYAVSGG
jgi:hypothetical protein